MKLFTRSVPVVAALGLVTAGLLVAPAGAQPGAEGRASATLPTCHTRVVGVLPSGRLIYRDVTNVRIIKEQSTATALPRIDSLTGGFEQKIEGGWKTTYTAHAAGVRPRILDVTDLDATSTLQVTANPKKYSRGVAARLVADSGSYFIYGLDAKNNLTQWTRYEDGNGGLLYATPKVILRNQRSIKTLTWVGRTKGSGKWADALLVTTRGGALKSLHVPWAKPANVTVRTIRSTGFADYTGASMTWCGAKSQFISVIYIDRYGNRAQWYTLANSDWKLTSSDLVRRRAVAPGANWHLHAVL